MFVIGDKNEMILLLKPPGTNHWDLVCFGGKRHYRKDGACKHTEAMLAAMRTDWHRARTRITPFGDRESA